MADRRRAEELAAFLRSRRRMLTPGDVGLPDGVGNRRATGLRREEVAAAASISADYYTRLEQGRRSASDSVLAALSRALRLTDVERRYLLDLARSPVDDAADDGRARQLRPGLRTLMDGVQHAPALVLGPGMQVLAWNPMLAAVLIDLAPLPVEERNLVWLTFMNAEYQSRFLDLDSTKDATLGYLRRDRVMHPLRQEHSDALIARLSETSAEFRRRWQAHPIGIRDQGPVLLRVPGIGDLEMLWESFTSDVDGSQALVLFTVEERSETAARLDRLRAGGVG
ncbi:MAG: helix-turn-helix domain-containing protein [Microbacterium sp.]